MATVFVGIGSNINPEEHIRKGMQRLVAEFSDCSFSNLYESESVGFAGDNFINLVAKFTTSLTVAEVVKILGNIEDESGRTRHGPKFSARTLDIDLLLYDDQICTKPVQLPRDEITKNAFVLLPLSELAADLIHPILKQSYSKLWKSYPKHKQKLWLHTS